MFTGHVTPRGPSSAGRGTVSAPVVVGGVGVRPGELLIGDAEAKLAREAGWEQSLAGGRSMQRHVQPRRRQRRGVCDTAAVEGVPLDRYAETHPALRDALAPFAPVAKS